MLQWRYEIEALLDVPPEAFDPPPRVESAVLRMTPAPAAAPVDPALLRELVTSAFSQRRKLLRHTLGRWLEARGANVPFDMQRRAEEVPVEEYLRLAVAVAASSDELRRASTASAGSRGRQPHRGVERAAHERHVRAEAAVRRCLRAAFTGFSLPFTLPAPGATSVARSHDPDFLGAGY